MTEKEVLEDKLTNLGFIEEDLYEDEGEILAKAKSDILGKNIIPLRNLI